MPEPDLRDQVIEVACIHLSAAWDDMSLADAEENWRRGLGYGAVGSDGHAEIAGVAAGLADAIHALYAATLERVDGNAKVLVAEVDRLLREGREWAARAQAAEAQVEALSKVLEEVRAELVYMQNGEKVKPYRLINTIDAALAPYPVPGSAQWSALETRALSAPADLGPSICEWQTRAPAEESSARPEWLEAAAPFFRLADEIVNAEPDSDSYREWLADSKDWTVIFSFAGKSITLGELRKAAAVAGAFPLTPKTEIDHG